MSRRILPNQRGFFNFIPPEFRTNRGIGDYLTQYYPANTIGTENNSGIGTSVDLVRTEGDEVIFYEIKTDKSVRLCIRKALSQLIEYSYWPDRKIATRLIVVSQTKITEQAKKYVKHLRDEFGIPIYYQQFDLESEELKELY